MKRTAIVVALAPLALLAWYLRDFLLVLVGSLLVATLLQLISEPSVRWCRLSEGFALAIAGPIILIAIAASGYLFGTQLTSKLQDYWFRPGRTQLRRRCRARRSLEFVPAFPKRHERKRAA